ncbi:hypothetical protein [Pseudonocardia sp.]|uniref:hypothetical protein n=1 Tax=Pseudonocardia sp. TaxID=60912 RepID=UPI0031FD1F61
MGVLVNLVFPPAVQVRSAAAAVERLSEEIAALLDAAGDLAAARQPAGHRSRPFVR